MVGQSELIVSPGLSWVPCHLAHFLVCIVRESDLGVSLVRQQRNGRGCLDAADDKREVACRHSTQRHDARSCQTLISLSPVPMSGREIRADARRGRLARVGGRMNAGHPWTTRRVCPSQSATPCLGAFTCDQAVIATKLDGKRLVQGELLKQLGNWQNRTASESKLLFYQDLTE